MKAKMQYLAKAILPSLIVCLIAGCGKPLEEAVVGTWKDKNHSGEYTVIQQDHTVALVAPGRSVSGRWEKISNDHLRLDLGVTFLHMEKIKISGDRMTFQSDGMESTLIRQK